MKAKYFGLLAVFSVLVFAVSVFAAEPGSVTSIASVEKGHYVPPTPQSVSVISGNVTEANLTAVMSTYRWAGLFGTVSGTIVLADSSNNFFYNWTGAKGVLVYASTANSITWSSLADATNADMPAWLTTAGAVDNYTSTFTGAAENIGSLIFTTLTSDYAAPYPTGSGWRTYSLTDGTNLVWAAKVVEDTAAYNGQTVDYELLLPEDGTANDATASTYYLWVELK